MSTTSVIFTPRVCSIGNVSVDIHGLVGGTARMALHFETEACGLKAGFHGTTAEMRAFAAELIRHADATDAAAQSQHAAA